MKNVRWTDAQLKTIGTSAQSAVVFAAAGSGKTATLTERIIRLITADTSPSDISRMLVVTFTRAAAEELRERIRGALSEKIRESPDPRLVRQLYNLPRAKISTIHSFCLSVLRPYYSMLGLPPDFRVADEKETELLKKRIMDQTVAELFESEKHRVEMSRLSDALGSVKNPDVLTLALLKLYRTLTSLGTSPDKLGSRLAEYAESCTDAARQGFYNTELASPIIETAVGLLDYYELLFASLAEEMKLSEKLKKSYVPAADIILDYIGKLKLAVSERDTDGLCSVFAHAELGTLKPVKQDEHTDASLRFKEVRESFKEDISSLAQKYFTDHAESLENKLNANAALLMAAVPVIEKFEEAFSREKKRLGCVDYSDLEFMCSAMLQDEDGSPSPIAETVAAGFDYMFVDEYQDTNRVQDMIFSSLAACGVKRFIVGDIKQSIYHFRGADPSLFMGYRERSLSGEDDSEAIFMSDNFRSATSVIDFVNLVSEYIFKPSPISFEEPDRLRPSRADDGIPDPPTEIWYLQAPSPDGLEFADESAPETVTDEAHFVARRIAALLSKGKLKNGAPIRPCDIAILLRSPSGRGMKYSSALAEYGIKTNISLPDDFYSLPEILLALSVLFTVDNPRNEIYLAGAMCSPAFGFTVSDIAELRLAAGDINLWDALEASANPDECERDGLFAKTAPELTARFREFYLKICDFRRGALNKSAGETVYGLFSECGLFNYRDGQNILARNNIIKLYEMARRMESSAYLGLHGFLSIINDSIENGDSPKTGEQASDPDAVTLLSIHSSKGLEFHVCIVADTAKQFNFSDQKDNLLVEPTLGASFRIPDETGLLRLNTPYRESIAAAQRRLQLEDEMRLLYVALTRARERLIITSFDKNAHSLYNAIKANISFAMTLRGDHAKFDRFLSHLVYSAQSFITWIVGAALIYGKSGDFAFYTEPSSLTASAFNSEDGKPGEIELDRESLAEVAERLDYKYPYLYLSAIPSKLTVSKLTPESLDIGDGVKLTVDPEEYGDGDDEVPRPSFMSADSAASGADRGTATHTFLQFCNFEVLRDGGADEELARLVREGFISQDSAALVDLRMITRFASSRIFREMTESPFLKREFRFNTSLPAEEFTNDPELFAKLKNDGIRLTVQGVIDAIYRGKDGGLVLVDYKTDALSREEYADHALAEKKLLERHRRQLTYYRDICEKIFEEKISHTVLFSLPICSGFEIGDEA